MLSENRTLARLVAMKTRDFDDPAFEDSCGREYLNSKRKIHKESSAIVHRSSEILVLRSKKNKKTLSRNVSDCGRCLLNPRLSWKASFLVAPLLLTLVAYE
jgi:hypothetical protein